MGPATDSLFACLLLRVELLMSQKKFLREYYNCSNRDGNICIIGLGFVGVTLATVMANLGFQVVGIERREEIIAELSLGNPHFFEPGLSMQLKRCIESRSLRIYKTIPKDCKSSVYIIAVGTPLNSKGQIDLESIQTICHEIALHLKDGDLVIVRSTVKLGTTRSVIDPIFKKTGKQYEIAYCPERTVEGQALEELRSNPQIIGADPSTAVRASQIFQWMTPTILRVSNWETAEMMKLVDNARRDVHFAFANEVARMCDVANLSAEEVLHLGRFGYVRGDIPAPGLVGGPCLSKDPHILVQSMEEFGMIPKMTATARQIHEEQPKQVAAFLRQITKKRLPQKMIISLLGIAFKGKPITDDVRGTPAKAIFQALKEEFPHAEYRGYDPVVQTETIKAIGLQPKSHLESAVKGAHLVLILNNHPQFSALSLETLGLELARPAVIYDFWGHYHSHQLTLPEGVQYLSLGNHKFAKEFT